MVKWTQVSVVGVDVIMWSDGVGKHGQCGLGLYVYTCERQLFFQLRDWSLITGRGGYETGGGGAHEVLPLRKGGWKKF